MSGKIIGAFVGGVVTGILGCIGAKAIKKRLDKNAKGMLITSEDLEDFEDEEILEETNEDEVVDEEVSSEEEITNEEVVEDIEVVISEEATEEVAE